MFIACMVAAGVTELLATVSTAGLSIWLPTGFVMGAAIASRKAYWPLWAMAGALAEAVGNLMWYGHAIGPAMLLIVGNAIAALTGAYVLRRITTGPLLFTSVRNTTVFLTLALLVVPVISATICSIGLSWSYDRPWLSEWPRIYLGDATGVVVAAPATILIMGAAASWPRFGGDRRLEALALGLALGGLVALALGGLFPYVFILLFPILWAALRFRIPGAIVTTAVLATASTLLTAADISPFGESALYGRFGPQGLQIFLIAVGSAALLVGAIAEENRAALRKLSDINRDLEERVAERSALLMASEARAQKTSQLLTAIGEACPDLIFAKDIDRRLIYANPATLAALELDKMEEDAAICDSDLIASASEAGLIRDHDVRVLRDGVTIVVEEPVTLSDGERRIYRSTKAPLYDADGKLAGLAGVSVDITDMKRAAAREKLLLNEIEHRGRNLLSVMQGIVQLTRADSVRDFQAAISRRLRALARTHVSIAAANWQGARFATILRDEFESYLDTGDPHVLLSGDDLTLDTGMAQSLALIIHELATNAAKYGALSTPAGRVSVEWRLEGEGADRSLMIDWTERDGPPVTVPQQTGFGSTMMTLLAEERPGGAIAHSWDPGGLIVQIVQPLPDNDGDVLGD
jgi:two-component sensor histidine kinase/integral membrane sensor domain MASE1